MAATTVIYGGEIVAFLHLSPTKLSAHRFTSSLKKTALSNSSICIGHNQICQQLTVFIPHSVSSAETPVLVEDNEDPPSVSGCKTCGKEEIESGCNGEGRIQGGIATVPGFGWWPIKAYRPCPSFTASGGRYKRTGQSMDEVVSG